MTVDAEDRVLFEMSRGMARGRLAFVFGEVPHFVVRGREKRAAA